MRAILLATALLASSTLAKDFNDRQIVLGPTPILGQQTDELVADQLLSEAQKAILQDKENMDRWMHDGKEYLKQNDLMYELVESPHLKNYKLRIVQPKLCDPSVKQYSGYLDIGEDKSLFFWYFDSRSSPSTDPLALWINGGPGCSSTTGLLFELGPCTIINEGRNTTYNPHSWNSNANIIFLDQPVDVGFSYSTGGATVDNSHAVGVDVHAFFKLFIQRFPNFGGRPLHIAGESYAGHYLPNIASVLYRKNKEAGDVHTGINLASVLIGNGDPDPAIQMAALSAFACDGPTPVYDDPYGPQCQSLRRKELICEKMIQACNRFPSRMSCWAASWYGESQLFDGALFKSGRNPYDVRLECDTETNELCYEELPWIESWMNDPANKVALGVDPARQFNSCNKKIHNAFTSQGDGVLRSADLLPELIENGIRLLIYVGNMDSICNYIGMERWLLELETSFQPEFVASPRLPFVTSTGKLAGSVRSAGGDGLSAGNITLVVVHDAGHMAPHDQPEATLDMFNRWIYNVPIAVH